MRRAYDYWQNQPGCYPLRSQSKPVKDGLDSEQTAPATARLTAPDHTDTDQLTPPGKISTKQAHRHRNNGIQALALSYVFAFQTNNSSKSNPHSHCWLEQTGHFAAFRIQVEQTPAPSTHKKTKPRTATGPLPRC